MNKCVTFMFPIFGQNSFKVLNNKVQKNNINAIKVGEAMFLVPNIPLGIVNVIDL